MPGGPGDFPLPAKVPPARVIRPEEKSFYRTRLSDAIALAPPARFIDFFTQRVIVCYNEEPNPILSSFDR